MDKPSLDKRPDAAEIGTDLSKRQLALIAHAKTALWLERLWRVAVFPLGVIALFLAFGLLGGWFALSGIGRLIGLGLFAAAFLAACVPLLRLRAPQAAEVRDRADRDGQVPHRPIATLADQLANGETDKQTAALWALHRKRAEAALALARPAQPKPDLPARDPFALRIAALLLVVLGLSVAGSQWRNRILVAFDISGHSPSHAVSRIDGWIDPPAYTRQPPVILSFAPGQERKVLSVPVNSVLVLRATGRPGLHVEAGGGLKANPQAQQGQDAKQPKADAGKPQDKPSGTEQAVLDQRWTLTERAEVTIKDGTHVLARLDLTPVPDRGPSINLLKTPQANLRGTLTLDYEIDDDYGVMGAEARFEALPPSTPRAQPPRPLVPAPFLSLSLPATPGAIGEGQSIGDFSAHPWGGARLSMRLSVKDEAGQEGFSEPVELVLPQRPFSKPLARALVEQRRVLAMDARARPRVLDMIRALMIAPERYTPQPAIHIGLRMVANRLANARSDLDLLDALEFLWGMALFIEDGDLSQSERDLRAAQEALREALERGANDEEIKRLTQELRQALDRHLRELAEQMRRDNQNTANDPNAPRDPSQRMVRPDDLKNMIDRMERMARNGDRDEAKRLLNELQSILDNLQTARPGQRQQDPMAREMNRSLDELDRMIRDQQALRDETFRQGQERRNGEQLNRPGQQRQQQRRNQQGQGRQQGQQNGQQDGGEQPQGERGRQPGQGQAGQGQDGTEQGGQGLRDRQQALREKVEELRRRMRSLGMNGDQGLGEAEQDMRQAEGSLGQGQEGEAVDAQGRALESLRRGMQNLAQQMQQMMEGMGEPGDDQAQAADDGDPLGRPQGNRRSERQRGDDPFDRPDRNRGNLDSRVKVPQRGESAVEQSQRVLEELRRRLGDPSRPRQELDYLRRLLEPY